MTESEVRTTFWSQSLVHAWNKDLEHPWRSRCHSICVCRCLVSSLRLHAPWEWGRCLFLLHKSSCLQSRNLHIGVPHQTVFVIILPEGWCGLQRSRHVLCAPRWPSMSACPKIRLTLNPRFKSISLADELNFPKIPLSSVSDGGAGADRSVGSEGALD